MAGGKVIQVFVPRIFEAPDARGVVVSRLPIAGQRVEVDDELLGVRSLRVDGRILSPIAGTVVRFHANVGDTVSAGALAAEIRSDADEEARAPASALTATAARLATAAFPVALSGVALVWPIAAVVLSSIAAVAIVSTHVPTRSLGGVALGVVLLVEGCIRLVGILLVAILVSGAGGAFVWLLSSGTRGLAAAARLAAFEWAPSICAVLVSRRFIKQLMQGNRAAPAVLCIRNLKLPASSSFLVVMAVWLYACVVVLPRQTWWPAANFQEAVDILPDPAIAWVRRHHAAWIEAEVRSVEACVERNGRGAWSKPVITVRGDGSLVASALARRPAVPGTRSVGVLMLALQNELEPQRATVVIHAGAGAAIIRFDTLSSTQPVREIARIVVHARGAGLASIVQ